MSMSRRVLLCCLACFPVAWTTGCYMAPPEMVRQSQLRAWQLYNQNKTLAMEHDRTQHTVHSLSDEKSRLARRASELQSSLDVANKRLENLNSERSQLHQRYVSLLNSKNPLSSDTTQRFQDLANRFPEFEFDPQTGVSKFKSDILFDLGSDALKPGASALLKEFAQILNQGDAKLLNVLIVGHTDDRPIARSSTRAKHPTNGHLSTNRAHSVRIALGRFGIDDARMGTAGYGEHQPLVPNTDDSSRAKNRRVEIFVLAPDAVVAGWDPATTRRR